MTPQRLRHRWRDLGGPLSLSTIGWTMCARTYRSFRGCFMR